MGFKLIRPLKISVQEKELPKYLLIILLSFLGSTAFSQQRLIDLNIKDASTLEEVITQLERNYDFHFSYKPEDVQDIKFTSLPKKSNVDLFLKELLKDTYLKFDIIEKDYIVLIKVITPDPPLDFFCGKVIDSLSREFLPYANAYIKNTQKGSMVGEKGVFQFYSSYEKNDSITISYVGYKDRKFLASNYLKRDCPYIELSYLDHDDDFIVVTEYLTDGVTLENNGEALELQPNKIGSLPGQVEPDVLSTVQFLPGVSSPDGSASGLSIRGGTPDQNLILWEDIPIYHAAHYFGMISAFNPYIINKVSVYRGGFGAEYGGRVSGLIDLKSEVNPESKNNFGAGTNFISAYTNGQLSLFKNKLSIVYSARRSITEAWRSPAFENITKRIHQGILVQNVDLNRLPPGIRIEDDFRFFDTNFKATYRPTEKDEISLAWFYGDNDFQDLIRDDVVRQQQTDTLFLKNRGVNLSWNHKWRPGFSTKVQGMRSDYNYEYGYRLLTEGNNRPNKFGFKNSRIEEQQFRLLNTYQTASNHTFKLAYELVNYDVGFEISTASQNNPEAVEKKDLNSNLHVLFAAYNSPKENKIGVDLGFRVTSFEQEEQQCVEPRIRLWYNANKHLNFYANAGKYYQFLSQLIQIEGDNSSIETPVWALAGGREVPVLDATQYQVGFLFRKNKWLFDIQAYTKRTNGLTSLTSGFDEGISNKYHIGNSQVRGFDVLLKKSWKQYKSWISYSLGKTEYNFSTFFDKQFAGPNDQGHTLNWANMWTFGNLEFSLGWKMATGRPYSLIDNFEIRLNPPDVMGPRESIFALVKEYNSEKLPLQHQLDASIQYSFYPKRKGNWKGIVGLSLFNVYHQRNIYSREFYIKNQPNLPSRLEYTDKVNMGFTPNFVVRVEW